MRFDVMKAAFHDELDKIAGELQGFTRSGRKPIGIDRMLERELEQTSPTDVFGLASDQDVATVTKEAKQTISPATAKTLGLLAAGAGGAHIVRKANEDRKMGKAMRVQSGGGGLVY